MVARTDLRRRLRRNIAVRVKDFKSLVTFLLAFTTSYRLTELLAVFPLIFCLLVLSCLPDWVVEKVDAISELALSLLLGGKAATVRSTDKWGKQKQKKFLFSVAGALDPEFDLPDRILAIPANKAEEATSFPSKTAVGYGNAVFLAMCMKIAYEDWLVVRDVVNHEWAQPGKQALKPVFLTGLSFHHMVPTGIESNEDLKKVHLDSDACILEVVGPDGEGKAVILAFRGTEPLELADFQSDFDAVPEEGDWGCLHPGFIMGLGLDPNLNPYHQTLVTYSILEGDNDASSVTVDAPGTPYEVLRSQLVEYVNLNPNARVYVCGHSLGGALAAVFTGALLHDDLKELGPLKKRFGALYTFGQPRVGDYEFACHLHTGLLESDPDQAQGAAAAKGGSSSGGGQGSTQIPGASLLARIMAGGGSEGGSKSQTGMALSSRYVRVVNTFDIVPHIPPTWAQVYQHTGDMVYLKAKPGQIQFLSEMPLYVLLGILISNLRKLWHYTWVLLGRNKEWVGTENYLRYMIRVTACVLPFFFGGLNDHLPGDYYQAVVNSNPAAWQPFKNRRKFARWSTAMMFGSALMRGSTIKRNASTDAAGAAAVAAAAVPGAAALEGPAATTAPLLLPQQQVPWGQGSVAAAAEAWNARDGSSSRGSSAPGSPVGKPHSGSPKASPKAGAGVFRTSSGGGTGAGGAFNGISSSGLTHRTSSGGGKVNAFADAFKRASSGGGAGSSSGGGSVSGSGGSSSAGAGPAALASRLSQGGGGGGASRGSSAAGSGSGSGGGGATISEGGSAYRTPGSSQGGDNPAAAEDAALKRVAAVGTKTLLTEAARRSSSGGGTAAADQQG